MNKYNIRAIRKELDDCIRGSYWKKFRCKLQSIRDNQDLCKAVVEYRTGPRHSNNKHGSLLHALCRCSTHSRPPLPIDILEDIVSVYPGALLIQNSKRQTALSLSIALGASSTIVECLLLHDKTNPKQSLRIADQNGDIPLVLAARMSSDDRIIHLLVKYDSNKQSLLVPSVKRQRMSLWYLASEELRNMSEYFDNLPEILHYMICQTYLAIQIQSSCSDTAVTQPTDEIVVYKTSSECSDGNSDDCYYYEEEGDNSINKPSDNGICHLQMAIACAHILGGKNYAKLVQFLLDNKIYNSERIAKPDIYGNLMLHYTCKANIPHLLEKHIIVGDREFSSLTEYLVVTNPGALQHRNENGELPLHLAIAMNRDKDLIEYLLSVHPDATRCCNSLGELPIHLALKNLADVHCDVAIMLWKKYPDAASVLDGESFLFPFQLAACYANKRMSHFIGDNSLLVVESSSTKNKNITPSTAKRHDDAENSANAEQLNIIYFFLRHEPNILGQFF